MRIGLIVATAVLGIAACGTDVIDASGEIVSEVREVESFTRLDASQGVAVRAVVDPAATAAVTVHYDDNVIDHVTTDVDGDTLKVRLDAEGSFRQGAERYVEVVMPDLDALRVSNGASVTASGEADALSLSASGGGSAALAELSLDRADVDLSGGASAIIQVTSLVEGDASGGASLMILGDPGTVDVATSGGADVSGG